jgi:hypothetical protein
MLRYLGKWTFGDRFDPDQIGFERLKSRGLPLPLPNPKDFPSLACVTVDAIDAELEQVSQGPALQGSEADLPQLWAKTLQSAKRKASDIWLIHG